MKKQKEINDNSVFTLDELIQESIDMKNFLKGKTNLPFREENYNETLNKFFTRSVKLRNASKNICWEKSNSPDYVSKKIFYKNIFIIDL